ncbi:efflux RND transporter permease subunit [Pseudothermotoga thermarum]|uniref:Acriflavin resistance protein n=1 Tax=Pseudothermotoga thermarum DSM 5069 TaxID=688269 RepID=F7YUK7_9THEM|nr:efflux RND transporter permease subunit [Pseudothermotoga thermarum]AEH51480.1 acriflavin resistance protein [Pseudothermotoga thermarum DSM 5069]
MNIAKAAAKRPVAVLMLLLAIVALSYLAFQRLHLELIPQVEYPYAAVFATYMGAGTEEIEELVTKPLEKVIATVPGVKNFTSVSQPGLSLILVEYEWGVDVLAVSSRLERYLNIAQAQLPEGVRPTVVEFDPSLLPVFAFSTLEDPERFIQQLKRLPDVAGVEVLGTGEKVVRITVDPQKVRQFQIDPSLMEMFLSGNFVYPMGTLKDENGNVYTVTVDGRFKDIDELKMAIVGFRGLTYQMATTGQMPRLLVPVRLHQVADVEVVERNVRGTVRVNGEEAKVIVVRKRSGANTVQTVRQVKKLLNELKVPYTSLIDQSLYTERAIRSLLRDLVLGLISASLVVLIFVLDFVSTAIVALSIPLSLVVAIVLMYFFNLNFDMLTLGGLTMAVGMLVDNAIVVFENIYRYKSIGKDYVEAAGRGTSEVFMAIFASTATTVIVFLPLVFTQSFAASMFKYFAATLSLALGSSLAVAGVLVPAGSRWIKAYKTSSYEKVLGFYKQALSKALDKKWILIAVTIFLVVISGWYVLNAKRSFIPEFANNVVTITALADEQVSYEKMSKLVKQVEDFILKNKDKYNVQAVYADIGITSQFSQIIGGASENKAYINVWLKGKRSEYVKKASQLVEDLKQAEFVGLRLEFGSGNYLAEIFGYPLTIELIGKDLNALMEKAQEICDKLSSKNVGQVSIRGEAKIETVYVELARDRTIFSGLVPGQVFMELQYYTLGKSIGTLQTEHGVLPVYLNYANLERINQLESVMLKGSAGRDVPLSAVSDVTKKKVFNSIEHKNGERVVYVDIVQSHLSTSDLVKITQQVLQSVNLDGITYSLAGQKASMDVLFEQFRIIVITAAILVFMLLSALFESFVVPFVIFSTVPIVAVAIGFVLILFGYSLNLPVLVGALTLVGIVVNNSIVMISFIKNYATLNNQYRQTIVEAASLRLRPILMTTLTTIIALLPVAFSRSEGSELESPIAWTIIIGLIFTTAFSLFVVPGLAELFKIGVKEKV